MKNVTKRGGGGREDSLERNRERIDLQTTASAQRERRVGRE